MQNPGFATQINPLEELAMMRPDMEVIAVELPENKS